MEVSLNSTFDMVSCHSLVAISKWDFVITDRGNLDSMNHDLIPAAYSHYSKPF